MSLPPAQDPGRKKEKNSLAAFLIPALVSVVIVWLLLRDVSWRQIVNGILAASPRGLALYALIAIGNLWLRALRFHAVLTDPKPAVRHVFLATLVQNALGDLVPAKLASFGSYVWLLKRRLAVSAESAAATFIVSFVLDLVTLGPFLIVAVVFRFGFVKAAAGQPLPLPWLVLFAVGFFAISLAAAWWLGPLVRLLERFVQTMAHGKRGGLWSRAVTSLERLATAVDVVQRQGALLRLLAISLAIRFIKYISLYVLAHSLLSGSEYGSLPLGIWDLIIGISITELIASLPLPAIGQFGVWEGGMVGALVLMGFARPPATLVAFGIHGITTAFEYLLCFLALGAMLVLPRRGKTTP